MADNVLSLDDLRPAVVRVEIEQGDSKLVIPLRLLTVGEWQQIGYTVPSPVPPISGYDKAAKPIVNMNDSTYLAQQAEAEAKRAAMRLAVAMEGGGIVIPGDDTAAKGETVRSTLDVSIYNALISVLIEQSFGAKGVVAGRAATFQL
jgi:hypothetical protein